MKDLTIMLPNRPGVLANMGSLLGKAGVNIEGISGTLYQDKGVIHILVEEAEKARDILNKNKIMVIAERDPLVLEIEDRPGALGKITQKLANAEINIDFVYLATDTRIVLGVDDLEKARAAL